MEKIKQYAAYYAIIDFNKNINNLLSGKNTILPINTNHMQELALSFRQKGKHKGKYSEKFDDFEIVANVNDTKNSKNKSLEVWNNDTKNLTKNFWQQKNSIKNSKAEAFEILKKNF